MGRRGGSLERSVRHRIASVSFFFLRLLLSYYVSVGGCFDRYKRPFVVQDDDDAGLGCTDRTNIEDARTMPGWDARVSRVVVVVVS